MPPKRGRGARSGLRTTTEPKMDSKGHSINFDERREQEEAVCERVAQRLIDVMRQQPEKKDEFLHLEQGELSVIEYEKKFIELVKYAMVLIASETKRCRPFLNGLRGEIRTPVVPIAVRSVYVQLVIAALRVEKSLGVRRPSSRVGREE
ncbi:hypothetical protein E5676_scaffold204G00730 [Cucumis melo var. makuwa]|uniref:Retrotransposon gag domain-containing protein n=1 Tax=Cucumis melo var. makuwa TaxID=1194695 RepID=A0A5D3D5N9_CUCMM|nr:hypothetical protein E5676_scaffold204G00730 [Cucumis melo var. makuwa]